MAKRSRASTNANSPTAVAAGEDIPIVGGREPCPCGSGRRYKACHGKQQAGTARVVRPFEGFASEPDWVALHDLIPAATSPLRLRDDDSRSVTLCTLLPMAWPAQVRQNGDVLLAAQTQTASGDVSRDLADALQQALRASPGTSIPPRPLPADAPNLSDLVDTQTALQVRVHSTFEFWLDDPEAADESARAALERANAAAPPTARLAAVEGAYWMQLGERRQVRWVLSHGESELMPALARLHASEPGLALTAGSRFLGSFRAGGLVVPVWDLPDTTEVEDVEEPAGDFERRLNDAIAVSAPLTGAERRAAEALRARQLTLH